MSHTRPIFAALLAGCALAAVSNTAAAAETDADFTKYCRSAFSNSVYQQRAQAWGIEHYCRQGGTLQGIDFGEACRMTTGNRVFRQLGSRVLCEGEPKTETADTATPLDLVKYCPAEFPGSSYQKRLESTGPVHYCRIPGASGGFVLLNIDLAGACRAAAGKTEYRDTPEGVVCEGPDVANKKTSTRSVYVNPRPRPIARNADPDAPLSRDGSETAPDQNVEGGEPRPIEGKPEDRGNGKISGLWTMTAGVLTGMTVNVSTAGLSVKITIAKLPAATARTAKVKYGLKRGDLIAIGSLNRKTLKLTTRLGVVGPEAEVKRACGNRVDHARWNTERWLPVFDLDLTADRIAGRHRGTEMLYLAGGCIVNHAPFGALPPQANQFLARFGGTPTERFRLDPAHLQSGAVAFRFSRVK